MAETVVESGVIRSPLDYYQELANHFSSGIGFQETDLGPVTQIYQLQSASVKRLSASVALCPDGIRTRDGDSIQVLILISVPIGADASGRDLAGQVLQLLGPASHREMLLGSRTSAAAWSGIVQLESELASTRPCS